MLHVNFSMAFDQLGYIHFLITQTVFYSKTFQGLV